MGKMVRIDETLLARASEAAGLEGAEAVVDHALRAFIADKAALALIALGGSDPGAWAPNEGDEPAV